MSNLLLKLKQGQKLRLLPISEDLLYRTVYSYYIVELEREFIFDESNLIDFEHHQKVGRAIRNYMPVEYNDEIYFIRYGMKIRDKIDKIIKHYNLKPVDFLHNAIFLDVEVQDVPIGNGRTVMNFDSCVVDISYNIPESLNDDLDFFNSKRYTSVKELYDSHINVLSIVNRPDIINHLNDNGYLKPEFNYLLRTQKINEIRSRKITTTKLKLWNKVSKVVTEAGDEIEDIGYQESDEKGDEVHQFMVDGYLFEVKLLDKI